VGDRKTNDAIVDPPIVTGLLGSDGTAEVKEGLSAGDIVIINPGEIASDDDANN